MPNLSGDRIGDVGVSEVLSIKVLMAIIRRRTCKEGS
jgi:hypothetical protein